jgi:membrane-bound ClpP family serine protease
MGIAETIQALGISGVIGFILIIVGAFKAPVFTMAMMLFALEYNEWGVLMIIISIIKWFNSEDKKEDKND